GEQGGLTPVELDATESRHDANFTSYRFEVRQSEPNKKKLLAGPGATLNNYAHVLLPEGTYAITLTVMDSTSEIASVSETITVGGSKPKDWRPNEVNWSFSSNFTSGDETETFYRPTGGLPLGWAHAIYETKTMLDSSLLGSSGGCGGMLNNAGNGIGIVTGVLGVGITIAAPEAKVVEPGLKVTKDLANSAGASTKIAGGNKSGACVQGQINAINDQLRYQEAQIQELYKTIDRDQEIFFNAMTDTAGAVSSDERDAYNMKLDEFTAYLQVFMEAAALWDGTDPWMSTGIYPDGEVLSLDLLKIAASTSSDAVCTVNKPGADCENVADDSGPIVKIGDFTYFSQEELEEVAGLTILGDCYYDCWQHVGPNDGKAGNLFLDLYTSYSEELFAEVAACTSIDPEVRKGCEYAPDNNVVPLFDQYNTAIAAQYLKSANVLQKSYSMKQLTNLYNYNQYVASLCSDPELIPGEFGASQSCLDIQQEYNGKPRLQIRQIGQDLEVNGTFYKHNGNICGTSNIAGTPEQNAEALKCAQQQLTMFYAQAFSVLYTNFLNFIITDGPVGSQAYPATNVVFPAGMANIEELNDALRNFNFRLDGDTDGLPVLGARFDYEYEIGRSLPEGSRTPIDLLTKVAGFQTNLEWSSWITDGVLYQSYHISDAAACLQTLLDFNASGQPDTTVASIYPNYEDCPSIFALHDGTSIGNGFYDGITVQPYSFKVSPGGAAACPAACNSCQSGFDINDPDSVANWTPGGQGLFTTSSGAKECRGFCSGTATTDVPGNTCGDYDFATPRYTDCTQCSSTLDLEVLALSAPMGGNVRQCAVAKIAEVAQAGIEGDTLTCSGSVYYGKRFLNSIEDGLSPGSGALASFKDVLDSGEYSVSPSLPAPDWNVVPDGSSNVYGDNGSWSLSCFRGELPIISGSAGNPFSPPTLEATCPRCKGCQNEEQIRSKRTCESGRWGNNDGQLVCESTGQDYSVSTTSVACTNEALGGDPARGFYKQCFCPVGNNAGWLRTDKQSETGAELTVLSCGNFKLFNQPHVIWEYGSTGGAQYLGDTDQLPPTFFRNNLTTSSQTKEIDIGQKGDTGSGVNYAVAFANLDTRCNSAQQELIIVDNTNDFVCTSPAEYRARITAESGNPDFGWVDPAAFPYECLTFDENSEIRNANNSKSRHYNLTLTPTNILAAGSGPGIPIDLVLQCSDDSTGGHPECDDQSSCMHMVSFKDYDDSASAEDKAQVMAKRGYACKRIGDRPQATNRVTNGDGSFAQMNCELADGREFSLKLGWDNINNRGAKIDIDWITQ
ncbi:MAG: hypothetical protein ACI9GB_002193, partial [Halioglobus sp.]